jgi:hypothetical protein
MKTLRQLPVRVVNNWTEQSVLPQSGRYFFKRVFSVDMAVEPNTFDHGGAHFFENLFGYLQVIIHLAGMVTDSKCFRGGIV